MIVVTRAAGHLGKLMVEQLLERMPAADTAVAVRDPQKVQGFAQKRESLCARQTTRVRKA